MKRLVRILFFIGLIYIVLMITNSVQANSINKISMDIFVDKDGNANITEVWNCSTNKGTECYHPYYNLGSSKITNLEVSENGNKYTTLSSWKTSGTISSKANKCGFNKVSNGIEICWGMSSYGTHTYTVKYTITNFVSNLNDSQMIYWTLIPYDFSETIGKVLITIHADTKFADTTDVWGYGNYGGLSYVYDGKIELESNGSLGKSEYMTVLVKLPLNTFNAQNKINKNFEYYLKMAEEGAVKYKESGSSSTLSDHPVLAITYLILAFARAFFPIIMIILSAFLIKGNSKRLIINKEDKKFTKDISYYRDIPCNNNIFRAYFIAYEYGIISKKTDILGAIILKWLKDGLIRIEQKEKGMIFKREDTRIILNETDTSRIVDTYEKKLFNMLYAASIDGILENKEFERWCNKSYYKVLNWFDDIIKEQRLQLCVEGLVEVTEKQGFLSKKKEYRATSMLSQMAKEIYGLKRFLLEYTLIPERTAIEVKLFENYLVFAQMLGIAKEVAKEFKDLYPDIVEQSHFYSYDNIIFIHMYSTRAVSAAYSARSRASSYSGGGGGFSSGGGGGGSFGGGGGGRRFPLKNIVFLF